MTVTIYKEGKVNRIINDVIHVLNHSAATADGGIDIEVQNEDCNGFLILSERIHLDRWDFYSVEA